MSRAGTTVVDIDAENVITALGGIGIGTVWEDTTRLYPNARVASVTREGVVELVEAIGPGWSGPSYRFFVSADELRRFHRPVTS